MLRINHAGQVAAAMLVLDGKLVGPWVDELRRAVRALRGDAAVCLNLEHLTFADSAGLSLLRILGRGGVQLVGVSPLIEGLLASGLGAVREHADADDSGADTNDPAQGYAT